MEERGRRGVKGEGREGGDPNPYPLPQTQTLTEAITNGLNGTAMVTASPSHTCSFKASTSFNRF